MKTAVKKRCPKSLILDYGSRRRGDILGMALKCQSIWRRYPGDSFEWLDILGMALKDWSLWEDMRLNREIERRNKALSQSSNGHKAGLKKHFLMETDDTDGDAQTSNEITYFSNHSDSESESESEADIDSNILSELSSDNQDSISEISEDMELQQMQFLKQI
ncbi:hypothetical protein PPACK8108_LOCUS11622 [Phakopsora pachyrhizi]|uniref:Uncharacterized protein n=1 Tax=Phakopsora pachyrhizi TaxID=170000 RepID=A0AAV0B3N5_PHAPC|nr:hypothetical protein PPACK8108_LOCUS11622 [Phakopsora pachyrhizi]